MTPKLWLSLQVAGVATAGGLAPGIWLAYQLSMRESVARKVLLGALAVLWSLPMILLARLFLQPLAPLPQAGAATGMLSALATVALGSRNRVADVNRAYGNAARSLGSSEWRIFWRVTLPLAWPGLFAASLLAFLRVWFEWSILKAL